MKTFLEKLKKRQDLSFEESKLAFNFLMNGKANDSEIFDFDRGNLLLIKKYLILIEKY